MRRALAIAAFSGLALAWSVQAQAQAQAPAQKPAVAAVPAPEPPQVEYLAAPPTGLPVIDRAAGDFSVVVLPDTQRYSLIYPNILHDQIGWIVDQKDKLDIRFVIHVGDLTDDDTLPEWVLVDQAFARLDGVVPYLVLPGNHDYDREAFERGERHASQYNAVFSPQRFLRQPWYGGHYGVSNNNSFAYFDGGGVRFLVLGLEYGPTDEVLDWAANIVKVHRSSKHQVILATHAYMNNDDTRLSDGAESNPHEKNPAWNDGEGIWNKLVRRFTNVPIVVSGHVTGAEGTGTLVSRSDGGAPVAQMLSDYQFIDHGGRGYLRLLVFRPKQRKLEVYTWSPTLQAMHPGPRQAFVVDMPIFGPSKKK